MPRIVEVPAFGLDRTETTLLDYRDCVRAGACPAVPDTQLDSPGAEYLPVVSVDRTAAQAYCRFQGGRLPRRREFERAARSDANWLFPWGDLYNSMLSNHGRFAADRSEGSDGFSGRAPVGSYAAGATRQGVLDLSGNVAEWVDPDLPDSNPQLDDAQVAPPVASSTAPGLVCGGDFATGAVGLAASSCLALDPRSREATVGFRCAYDGDARLQRAPSNSNG